jgi:hypothetical protein
MTDLAQAILALKPDAKVSVNAEDIDQITWYDGNPSDITKSQILAKQAKLQAAEPIRLLRVDRDQLLAESDWTGLADSALISEASAKWKLYRQRLRDMPSGLDTPAKVKAAKWPAKP